SLMDILLRQLLKCELLSFLIKAMSSEFSLFALQPSSECAPSALSRVSLVIVVIRGT
ncbi:hypothetical protein P7K49_003223, partial [Saguinus oedipus]